MGVDGAESEFSHVAVENGTKDSSLNGVGVNEPIKFGTHGTDEPARIEASKTLEANFPKDAVDEWPEAKKFHSVYFVKYRAIEDQNLKAKLNQADKEIARIGQAYDEVLSKLRAKKADRSTVIEQLKTLGEENKGLWAIMTDKRTEMKPIQEALGKLRGPSTANRDSRSYICSSEQELDDVIKSLQYRIQHEVISLSEEKKIIKEIKQLEGTRDKVIANAAMREGVEKSMGEKDVLQDQVKLIGVDLDGVRKDQQAVKAKIKTLQDQKFAMDDVITSLQDELRLLIEKKDKAYEKIRELRKQRDDGNSCFMQNRALLAKARTLAANKDVSAIKELSVSEVDTFMSQWNNRKAFRDDYEKRILQSLDIRQLTRDGRMRNPGDKPLVSQEIQQPVPVGTEALAKPKPKQLKEDSVPVQEDTAPIEKEKKSENPKDSNAMTTGAKDAEEEEVFGLEKKPMKTKEIDVAKLKEMKREEEIAKAKQALERKKKLAEKAAAKAKIKAEKEAEKKLKEREKKAKKKMQASAPVPEPEEAAATEEADAVSVPEPEKAEENVKVPPKSKERKDSTTMRSRGKPKGPESISKVILKRKKSNNYMYYYAASAAVLAVMLLAIGYKFYA